MKTFGKANDKGVSNEEFAVAKLVQNARAYGLGWTKNTLYRDRYGKRQESFIEGKTTRCCAIGAALLDKSTKDISIDSDPNDIGHYESYSYEIFGNDDSGIKSRALISMGYRLAMR